MQKELIDRGILCPSGEIVKETTDRVYTLLTGLYQEGRETEMLEVRPNASNRARFVFSLCTPFFYQLVKNYRLGKG